MEDLRARITRLTEDRERSAAAFQPAVDVELDLLRQELVDRLRARHNAGEDVLFWPRFPPDASRAGRASKRAETAPSGRRSSDQGGRRSLSQRTNCDSVGRRSLRVASRALRP